MNVRRPRYLLNEGLSVQTLVLCVLKSVEAMRVKQIGGECKNMERHSSFCKNKTHTVNLERWLMLKKMWVFTHMFVSAHVTEPQDVSVVSCLKFRKLMEEINRQLIKISSPRSFPPLYTYPPSPPRLLSFLSFSSVTTLLLELFKPHQ